MRANPGAHVSKLLSKGYTMKTTLLIGNNAYACIKHDAGNMDILLAPGKSASASLCETAREWREKAARLLRNADLADQAAIDLNWRQDKI